MVVRRKALLVFTLALAFAASFIFAVFALGPVTNAYAALNTNRQILVGDAHGSGSAARLFIQADWDDHPGWSHGGWHNGHNGWGDHDRGHDWNHHYQGWQYYGWGHSQPRGWYRGWGHDWDHHHEFHHRVYRHDWDDQPGWWFFGWSQR